MGYCLLTSYMLGGNGGLLLGLIKHDVEEGVLITLISTNEDVDIHLPIGEKD